MNGIHCRYTFFRLFFDSYSGIKALPTKELANTQRAGVVLGNNNGNVSIVDESDSKRKRTRERKN